MIRIDAGQKYMTVPAAIRELEKIEMFHRNRGSYKIDHAVTKIQKIILSSFGLDEMNIAKSADVIMDAYLKSGKSLDEIMTFLKP